MGAEGACGGKQSTERDTRGLKDNGGLGPCKVSSLNVMSAKRCPPSAILSTISMPAPPTNAKTAQNQQLEEQFKETSIASGKGKTSGGTHRPGGQIYPPTNSAHTPADSK